MGVQQEAPLLLSHKLSQVLLWSGTPDELIKRGKDLATTIVPATEIERWKQAGYTVRRGCYAIDGRARILVQITGPKGFKKIELAHTLSGFTGKVGAQDLNGSTPATAQDLIQLIDQLLVD